MSKSLYRSKIKKIVGNSIAMLAVLVVGLISPLAIMVLNGGKIHAAPAFQMPFPCGEMWWASTYSGHNAIDWNDMVNGDDGRTVVASLGGTATASSSSGYGNYVLIDHGGGWKTRYAHLKQQGVSGNVGQGQVIGKVGNTGNSEGSHLHWEQIHNGVRQSTLYANGSALQPGTAYNSSDPQYISNNCGSNTISDIFQASGEGSVGWRVSHDGVSGWQQLNNSTTNKDTLMIGDFDQDGRDDDVFQASGVAGVGWRVSINGTGSWQSLKNSTTTKGTLMIGDFDEDGYNDDILQASGVAGVGWRVSYNGTSGWHQLKNSTTRKETLLLGDFDGDGYRNDIMQASGVSGAGWRVTHDGIGGWQSLKNSTTRKDTLLIGDFDQDGHEDDVLQASGIAGAGWRVAYNGVGGWQQLNNSTTNKDTLMVGDFDGNGYNNDLFQASGVAGVGWRVSYNGTSGWQQLKNSTTNKETLMIAEFGP